jgi:hypothetical protein
MYQLEIHFQKKAYFSLDIIVSVVYLHHIKNGYFLLFLAFFIIYCIKLLNY